MITRLGEWNIHGVNKNDISKRVASRGSLNRFVHCRNEATENNYEYTFKISRTSNSKIFQFNLSLKKPREQPLSWETRTTPNFQPSPFKIQPTARVSFTMLNRCNDKGGRGTLGWTTLLVLELANPGENNAMTEAKTRTSNDTVRLLIERRVFDGSAKGSREIERKNDERRERNV